MFIPGANLIPSLLIPALGISGLSGLQEQLSQCPRPPVTSCSADAGGADSCCVVTPGGVLVHAQFWDLGYGVADSWGIHGLWPDKCDGTFYENCDSSRAYSGGQITQLLQDSGNQDLLDYMNTYWIPNNNNPEAFWAHEWATHGTCVSTLEPNCIANYQEGAEVVPYLKTVVGVFQGLDTYKALTSAGITPSHTKTYRLDELLQAVESATSYVPDFVCKGKTLSTVQYYLNAVGPLQNGQFLPSHATRKSSCPSTGIKWPPKELGN
ncbi:hypothetical protein JAAARDRAFT_140976 [Jaapia argillacea MUCL 33604]|uniref:ribonuclease T2 n=1 Tax=Jaapia argillacea MUCL 33604 TaxID=933084 RepID=A0A067P8F4_9AGAM|nr:hypothetical protein JAAARDRAFT_140976 [Jaapia argillacea MUCL 33604]